MNNAIDMPKCPECESPVSKAGFAWSGRRKVQRWRCQNCGRTTIAPLFEKKESDREWKPSMSGLNDTVRRRKKLRSPWRIV